jgi:uncharacterized protein YggE
METQYFEKETRAINPLFKIITIIAIIFLSLLTIYLFFAIQNTSKETKYIGLKESTINVSGTGIVYAVPDVALVTFSAITEEGTINNALSKNKDKINRVYDFLARMSVPETDIKNIDFNVYPKYEWQTKGIDLTLYPSGKRVIVGYEAVESLEVIMRDDNVIGKIIQGSIDAGASQVSDLKFVIKNEDELREKALNLAIEEARNKAQKIASSLGVKLGSPVGLLENYDNSDFAKNEKSTIGSGEKIQIFVGENKVESRVSISYEIK